MSDLPSPELIIPITGSHVTEALAQARASGEASFRREQLEWLHTRSPRRASFVESLFARVMTDRRNLRREEIGPATMLGNLLGDRAIQLCLEENSSLDYNAVRDNFSHNAEQESVAHRSGNDLGWFDARKLWDAPPVLQAVFGDEEIVNALMSIKNDFSRDAAARTIGLSCLRELPNLATLAAT